mmetsp:Transcript_4179/g.9170  ORF Transcript_4179/g.9170 Transcript_4179/m.9170 type:complete len:239 (-) Transcript_4179:8-724(-)
MARHRLRIVPDGCSWCVMRSLRVRRDTQLLRKSSSCNTGECLCKCECVLACVLATPEMAVQFARRSSSVTGDSTDREASASRPRHSPCTALLNLRQRKSVERTYWGVLEARAVSMDAVSRNACTWLAAVSVGREAQVQVQTTGRSRCREALAGTLGGCEVRRWWLESALVVAATGAVSAAIDVCVVVAVAVGLPGGKSDLMGSTSGNRAAIPFWWGRGGLGVRDSGALAWAWARASLW